MKMVYAFGGGKADGSKDRKDLLGGKGAGLAEMTNLGIPVPPGFTISTEVCTHFFQAGNRYPDGLEADVKKALARVEELVGTKFGDATNPLLVSVRSGARASMPGMMDTILNLGINDRTAAGIAKATGDERFAMDAFRRFVSMYSDIVLGVKRHRFEELLTAAKKKAGVRWDHEVPAELLRGIVEDSKKIVVAETGKPFPDDPHAQLWGAIGAVFESWNNERAKTYRHMYDIPDDWGTAVNVQAMVFGNLGDTSATGVCFSRDPGSGEKRFFGEYLPNAQGEDVVAGIRTPLPITKTADSKGESMEERMPVVYGELRTVEARLEKHFKDMQDMEFTVQRGKLWLLQTRTGKRTARAAVRIAVEMVAEGLIDQETAILRVDPSSIDQLLHPTLDPKAKKEVIARGLPASPGAASGRVVFTPDEAERLAQRGQAVILVRTETTPEDIHGMKAARGILTARGGMTCVAGETRVLTDRGLLTAEEAFALFEKDELFRILSFDNRTMKPVWRDVIAAGRRPSEVISVSVSQTGRVEENVLRLTADHKMLTVQRRKLAKKPLDAVLTDGDFVNVVDSLPSLGETVTSPALAYVAGAVLSDGYVMLKPTKGSVTFIQKPTPEKAEFIAAVEHAFEQAFGMPFTYLRERETVSELKGRTIRGSVEDRISFRREPAARLAAIRDDLVRWVLSLDRTALLHFLAGFVDGDGTFAEESSEVRLQISVSASKASLLEGLVIACLRLGVVPQVTNNRENFTLQIAEGVQDIVALTHRVKPEVRARTVESKCFSVRALFEDIGAEVNYMGRVKEGLKRDIMFGAEKIRRDVLPLCPGDAYRELSAVLDSSLRSYRVKKVGDAAPCDVFNFEVDARDEIDKNFVVFSSRLTPVLVSNSHAAVVARGMGKCCVAGCSDITVDYVKEVFFDIQGKEYRKGELVTLDGSAGEVMLGEVPTIPATMTDEFETIMKWADKSRRLGVRANADTPLDAKVARGFGAEGIGLCRTEHMFFETERISAVREMILSADEAGRRAALAKIQPMQREDFVAIFREMNGLPVTIRLLDPPLHEFLPERDDELKDLSVAMGVSFETLRRRREALREFNPMLGHRGCRLGVTYPEIYEVQIRAIAEAVVRVRKDGVDVIPEIMIPLVATAEELRRMRELTVKIVEEVFATAGGTKPKYTVGTMIELPRACVRADTIAVHADFFSFGTNDLTQTGFGLSRDDAGKFLPAYVEMGVLPKDPFVALDQDGVGELMKIAIERAKKTKPDIKLGICGEHGGEPSSVEFCHTLGLSYVSCSPFRVPVARIAAAQAAIREKRGELQGVHSTA